MAFYNVKDYSYLLKQDCSVVITGDSLAYNRYDFVDEPRTDAWDCPFAMQSWSFLLRDFLISNSSGWIPAEKMKVAFSDNITISFKKNHDARVPLENQIPLDSMNIENNGTTNAGITLEGCPHSICCITQPDSSKAALQEVTGNPNLFGGTYFKWIQSLADRKINIKEGTLLTIAGAAETKTDVSLTGSGSKTAEWLLENIDERILRYKPNLVIMIIGANNRREYKHKSFKAALYEIIKKLKAAGSELILIWPPHSTTSDPPWGDDNNYECDKATTKPILDVLRTAAVEYNLTYINLFEFFSGVPNEKWRFDNTHFTRQGNLMLFEAIRNRLFTEV